MNQRNDVHDNQRGLDQQKQLDGKNSTERASPFEFDMLSTYMALEMMSLIRNQAKATPAFYDLKIFEDVEILPNYQV